MQRKIELLKDIDKETHIKAYEFILKMVRIRLAKDEENKYHNNEVKQKDIKNFIDMKKILKCLNLQDIDKAKPKSPKMRLSSKESSRSPQKTQRRTQSVPFFEEEQEDESSSGLLVDKFDSIEDLNNYYMNMKRALTVKEFKQSLEKIHKIQENIPKKDPLENDRLIVIDSTTKSKSQQLPMTKSHPNTSKSISQPLPNPSNAESPSPVKKQYKLNLDMLSKRRSMPSWQIQERALSMMYTLHKAASKGRGGAFPRWKRGGKQGIMEYQRQNMYQFFLLICYVINSFLIP
ncbi:unnamed protein product [Moneuplotes crassus]|uniref:Uncharacterized protein n=1 Tax=Euplotes crassus TaxID=5936 RepID=A0AAD1Y4U0_EUPCR|nr:unnamed protein product [Moneuplotes crassus]